MEDILVRIVEGIIAKAKIKITNDQVVLMIGFCNHS